MLTTATSFWHWLINDGHADAALVGWTVGLVMTGGVMGMIVRPTIKRLKEKVAQHEATQRSIAQALDTSTPGGLTDVVDAVRAVKNVEEAQLATNQGVQHPE